MTSEIRRKTPEELLLECQAEEAAAKKGHLKIFLGYASGVGKSFRMLDEARRRRERGQDVVVGAIQPQVPPDIEALLKNLEVIPLKKIDNGAAIAAPTNASGRKTATVVIPSTSISSGDPSASMIAAASS